MGVRPLKDTKVKHQLDDRLVQTDLRVTVVLAELLRDKDCLFFQRDVTNFQIAQFARTNEGVVLHHASEKEGLVVFLQIDLHTTQHLRRQVLAKLLVMFRHHFDAFHRIGVALLSRHHELSKAEKPTTIVVTCARTAFTVEINPVDEVVTERLVELVGKLDGTGK